jgi:hypothetical protein
VIALVLASVAVMSVSPVPHAQVAFTQDGAVWSMRPDGSERKKLVMGTEPDFDASGNLVYVRDGELFIAAEDGSGERSLGVTGAGSPRLSLDAPLIAFHTVSLAGDALTTRIEVINRDGTGRRAVVTRRATKSLVGVTTPVWSASGDRIYYTRAKVVDGAYDADVHSVALDGGDDRLFLRGAVGGDWSHDGSRFAFGDTTGGNASTCGGDECTRNADLAVTDASGAGRTRITATAADESDPRWSLDGTRILFSSGRNTRPLRFDETEIYSVLPNGDCLTWLTNGSPESADPVWTWGGGPYDAGGCGAVGRVPTVAVEPPAPAGDALWVGPQLGSSLLVRMVGAKRSAIADYSDCAAFDPAGCPPAFLLDTADSCSKEKNLGFFLRRARGVRRVGRVIVADNLGSQRGLMLAGRSWLHLQLESSATRGETRALHTSVARALRLVRGGPPGKIRLPRSLLRRLPASVRGLARAC